MNRVIRWSYLLLFFFVPLIFTPYNYELFEYNKMMLTYGLTVIIIGSFLIKSVVQGKIEIQKTPFDIPLMLFLFSQIISTIFSIDKHTSLFGYYSRFHQGLLSTISYISLFYIFVSEFKQNTKFVYKCIHFLFASAFLVSIYGILQRLGIDKKIWVQDVQSRVFSSLGQPNWLAAYLAVLLIIAVAFFLKEQGFRKFIFIALSLTFYIVIIFTKSRSGFGGFWAGTAVFSLLISSWYALTFLNFAPQSLIFFQKIKQTAKTSKISFPLIKQLFLIIFLLIISSFIFGTPFSQLYPYTLEGIKNQIKTTQSFQSEQPAQTIQNGSLIEYGGTESGTIRKIVWKGAIDIFKHYPLVGSGVETFAYAYYQFRPQEHNLTSEWDFLYNKAHNEYLNFAATTGIFGLSTYLLFILAFLFWAVKKFFKNPSDFLMLAGIIGAYTSILFSNFFGFSVVIIGIFFFILPAFSLILGKEEGKSYEASIPSHFLIIIFLFFLICYLLFSLIQMWRADKYFNQGYQYYRANLYVQAYTYLKKAIELNPREPIFKEELVRVGSDLTVMLARENKTDLSDQLKNEALIISNNLINNYPKNVNFFKTRTKVLHTLSEIDQDLLKEALNAILKAWELAPNDTKIAYNAGLIYAKLGDNDRAIETLKKSVLLKPNYYEPRWALALFYEQIGDKKKAVEQLNVILKEIRPNDEAAKNKLQELQTKR